MKTYCVMMCRLSDVEIAFDDNLGCFIVTVAVHHLPQDQKIDTSSLERMAKYFEHLRTNMTKINKGHDGWKGNIHTFTELDAKITELKKSGYIIPNEYRLAVDLFADQLLPAPKNKRAKPLVIESTLGEKSKTKKAKGDSEKTTRGPGKPIQKTIEPTQKKPKP